MIKRAVFARELGVPIVMHDYLTGGFTANTSLSHYCRDNGPWGEAALLLTAGAKGNRSALPSSTIMIKQVLSDRFF
jgi:hypothetical protein